MEASDNGSALKKLSINDAALSPREVAGASDRRRRCALSRVIQCFSRPSYERMGGQIPLFDCTKTASEPSLRRFLATNAASKSAARWAHMKNRNRSLLLSAVSSLWMYGALPAMAQDSPLITHTLPLAAMAASLGIGAMFFLAAARVVQTRQY